MTDTMVRKLMFVLLKYLPFIATIGMTIYTTLAIFDIRYEVLANVFGFSVGGCILFYLASVAFRFCNVHRMLIFYPSAVFACISYRHFLGDSSHLDVIRYIVAVSGIILIFAAIRKYKSKFNE